MRKVLTVAARSGELAVAQTRIVTLALKKIYPDIRIRVRKVTTRGDRDRRTTLWKLKTSGFFTTRVEDTLLAGQADLAVHSFKDLPTHQREGLTIAAVCERQFAEDCLLAADSVSSIEKLPEQAKIGTSSLRRAVQVKRLRADLKPMPVRGNVLTRIKRLEACPESCPELHPERTCPELRRGSRRKRRRSNRREKKFDAIILARAGIERLGLRNKISFCFDPKQFIPAPAQGALAVQTRSDDKELRKQVSALNDEKTRIVTFAERKVLAAMQCGCHAPAGAFAEITGDDIQICAFISDLEGKNFISREITGPITEAKNLAEKLASELLSAGGKEILETLKNI